ncbi:retroviral-like aspartic protease family protein [Limobrevibacterium gyesilva]|uniref:Retroviral-like aspartic protease family protein n=1 Tax=Limobrevibacterium gyesilva TaxID=2991712 RepID=A0AA41YR82_9PROT|nr:retroviral-like aspartic protease family protein [Limobrevibacterium gyesilva]MCW3476833.1 retroviral-like aspartic protease family protein [Limobrevibacterium gyesilva]
MRFLAPLRLLPLLLALAACVTAPRDDFDYDTCGLRPRAAIAVEMRGNVPLVKASIKGKPTTFILDTGADSVVLTETALRRLDLETDAGNILAGRGAGGESRFFAGKLRDFEIAGIPVPDHPVRVLPRNSPIGGQEMIDGLFGASVLSAFEIDLDLPRRRVTLYAGRMCPDTTVPPWTGPYTTIDASASNRGRFMIPVVLDGRPLMALLDTGAAASLVARDVAAALGVTPEMLARDPSTRLVGTGPSTPTAHFHRFREIKVGDETFPAPAMLVTDRPEPGIDMIIGSDYLGGRRIWLSYARKRVFIDRSGAP